MKFFNAISDKMRCSLRMVLGCRRVIRSGFADKDEVSR